MTYPSDNTPLPTYAGTALQGDIDHAGWHDLTNADVDGIKDTLGTTAGTSVLKNFTVGDFAAKSSDIPDTTGMVTTSGTQTLTNKTLTSPKINEDVALTATATQLNAVGSGGVTTRLSSKVLSTSRDISAIGGDVSYTGVGFTPTAIVAYGATDGLPTSFGMADSSKAGRAMMRDGSNNFYSNPGGIGSVFIFVSTSAGHFQSAVVKSWDADGFTLTWSKTGTPTGTLYLQCLCFR